MRSGRRIRAAAAPRRLRSSLGLLADFSIALGALLSCAPATAAPEPGPKSILACFPVVPLDRLALPSATVIAAASSIADLPPCARAAEIQDSAGLPSAGLKDQQKVVDAQPGLERTQVGIAQLLLNSGDALGPETAAASGLQVLPRSSAFYLVAAEALQRQGKEYAARELLVQGLKTTGSVEILSHLAAIQDAHGEGAADLYTKLAEAPEFTPEKQLAALERGFTVALRDGELTQAKSLADRLEGADHPEFQALLQKDTPSGAETTIPGGREGLAMIAFSKNNVKPNEFLAEFARALVANICTGFCTGVDEYKKGLEEYFATVDQLESLGTRDRQRVSIALSLGTPDESRRTEKVLNLLGIELYSNDGALRVVEGAKRRQIKRQDMVAALGIDVIGIQKALQSGKSYSLEITDGPVTIYPGAEIWKAAFPGCWNADFAKTLLKAPQIAKLYVSISQIDRQTLDTLFHSVSPAELANRFAQELSRFGPAFAVSEHQAVVPGGQRAAAVWAALGGVSPGRPGAFLRALLDQPALLAFFYQVSELDARHQAFFTANFDRATRFYTLSKGLTNGGEAHKDLRTETSFLRFLRSVPLDEQGHVIFPGSPRVWLTTKGGRTEDGHSSHFERRTSPAEPAETEDQILSLLAETEYDVAGLRSSELDNFIAVSQLNAHLREPMDEQSATLLAQNYAEYSPLYAYLSDLSGVNQIGLSKLFSIIDRIRQKPKLIQNLELGQLDALLGWVSILARTQALSGEQAAQLFSQIDDAMQAAEIDGPIGAASLNLAKSIVAMCGESANPVLDDAVRHCMLGDSADRLESRASDFQRVLELQKAPRLDDLQTMADAAQHILSAPEPGGKPNDGSQIDSLQPDAMQIVAAASHLPAVRIPGDRRVRIREREAIELYDPSAIQKCAAHLSAIAGQPNPNLRALKKAARALLNAILPQITAALAAPIYAYYLRSTDLVVSDDPLLLRKHRYVDYVTPLIGSQILERPQFVSSSEGVGSHFVGGFGNFALTAGHAAAPAFRQGGWGGEAMIAAQIAAIRSAPWDRLTEPDQRLAALRILAAREWIVQAALDPEYFDALSRATLGLVAPARRSHLLEGLANRDWSTVWRSVPLPDLYMLGAKFSGYALARADSPVFRELHSLEMTGAGANVNYLGHVPYLSYGCGHLHLVPDLPYEEYAQRLMQEDLAERTADFKLYLAALADNLGVEPQSWGPVAEKLAARAFAASQLADYHDWRSMFDAYESITTNDMKKALVP